MSVVESIYFSMPESSRSIVVRDGRCQQLLQVPKQLDAFCHRDFVPTVRTLLRFPHAKSQIIVPESHLPNLGSLSRAAATQFEKGTTLAPPGTGSLGLPPGRDNTDDGRDRDDGGYAVKILRLPQRAIATAGLPKRRGNEVTEAHPRFDCGRRGLTAGSIPGGELGIIDRTLGIWG